MTTELDRIYARIPKVECKGLCQASCGPIAIEAIEADAIRDNGFNLPVIKVGLICSAMTNDGKCGIYPVRPTICRLWGAVKSMRCPHGCRPKGGFADDQVMKDTLAAVARLSNGRPTHYTCPKTMELMRNLIARRK